MDIQEKVDHFARNSVENARRTKSILGVPWYLSQFRLLPSMYEVKTIQSRAMSIIEKEGKIKTGSFIGLAKPLEITIDPMSLVKLQNANSAVFYGNHQDNLDIAYACQASLELLGDYGNLGFIMKSSLPMQGFFENAGGIPLKRGKDIAREKETGKSDKRPYILNLLELPEFIGKYVSQTGRNMLIYPEGTRKTGDESLDFKKRPLQAIESIMQYCPESEHVRMIIEYTRRQTRMHIKVLSSQDGVSDFHDLSFTGIFGNNRTPGMN